MVLPHASEQTDAPQSTVVVENTQNSYLQIVPEINDLISLLKNIPMTNDSANACRPEKETVIISRELKSARIDNCALSEMRREGMGNIVERKITAFVGVGETRKKPALVLQAESFHKQKARRIPRQHSLSVRCEHSPSLNKTG